MSRSREKRKAMFMSSRLDDHIDNLDKVEGIDMYTPQESSYSPDDTCGDMMQGYLDLESGISVDTGKPKSRKVVTGVLTFLGLGAVIVVMVLLL